ncbi:hypothetical protein ACSBR1_016384 [Camellia fascicularis]
MPCLSVRKEEAVKEDEAVKTVIIPHDPSHSQRVHWPQSLRHRQTPRPNPHCHDEDSGKILNLVFVWADEGSKLKVDVPIVFKGDVCPGLKKGGTLNKIRTTLKYLCPAEHIPSKIEVDVSNLDTEDKKFMHDIEVHPSLKLLNKDESIPICKVVATTLENSEPTL